MRVHILLRNLSKTATLFCLALSFPIETKAQEVNLRNANFYYQTSDLRIQKPGEALDISRSYNSRSNTIGSFGYGWSTGLDTVAQDGPDGSILITDSDGYILRYTFEGAPREQVMAAYVDRLIEARRAEDAGVGANRAESYYVELRVQLLSGPEMRAQMGRALPLAWADVVPGAYMTHDRGTERLTRFDDGSMVRIRSDGSRQRFNSKGQLIQVFDVGGRGIELDYDREHRLSRVIHTDGGSIVLSWGSESGLVTGMQDTSGRSIAFSYDDNSNLLSVVGPADREERYIYDNEHNLTAILETGGRQVQVAYDAERDWATGLMLGEDLSNYSWRVLEPGVIMTTVDSGGVSTVHTFDDNAHRHVVEGPGGREETLLSSCCNKPLQVTSGDGTVTTYEYDRQARLVSVTHPDGTRVRWAYHPTFSRILQAAYSDGRRYDYTYDDFGNLSAARSSEGIELALSYGPNGKVDLVTGSDSSEYTFRYDTSGRPVEIGAGEEGALRIAYGAAGEIAGTEISQGAVSRAEFYRNLRRVLDLLEPATGR